MRNSIKKITAVLLALLVMIPVGMIGISADDAATTETPKYEKTENWGPNDEGIYEIHTPGDLLAMTLDRSLHGNYKGKTVVLMNDIDLNPGWDAKSKTAPTNMWPTAFYMQGTFDGQGHTIRGLCVINEGGDNAVFATIADSSVYKNLRVENSYFCATKDADGAKGNCAGFVAAVRGATPKFENVYMDIICEAAVNAGGFVSFFNCTQAWSPKITFVNCIFAGSVHGGKTAGGFVGSNDHPENNTTAKGTFPVVFENCANYGTITCDNPAKAGGFIGECAGEAILTNCYNGGNVGTAFVNIHQSTLENLEKKPVVVTLNDCYYDSAKSVKAVTKTAEATTLAFTYDAQEATAAKAATLDELLAIPAFKTSETNAGWAKDSALNVAVPMGIACLFNGHDFDTRVVAPTCAEKGYTESYCKKCGTATQSDFVDTIEHTPSEEWIVDKEPTEDFAGSRHLECTVCHKTVKTEILPKLEADSDTETEAADTSDTVADTVAGTVAGDDTPDTTDEKAAGGCGSAIGASVALVATLVLGTAVVSKKRR